jgi:hypothetical protein
MDQGTARIVTDHDAIIERMLREQRERDLADARATTPPVRK